MRWNLCPVSGAGLAVGRRNSLIRAHSTPQQCPKAFTGVAAKKVGYSNSIFFLWTFRSPMT